MNLLPNWCLTNTKPGFYDTESGTTIEQTARVYQAMNELIAEYNTFADNCNKIIEDYITGATKDNETFRIALRQEFQDFIDVIELKMLNQDKEIAETVEFMKNNIVTTIETIMIEMRENGELNEVILTVLDNVKATIDTETTVRENADNDLLSMIQNIENKITFTTPKLFGAVGDGLTDDSDAIRQCIYYANEHNLSVIFEKGVTYKVDTGNITVRCSIDFNGSTIKVNNNNGTCLFEIVSNNGGSISDAENKIFDESVLTSTGVLNDELKGKSFTIHAPLDMGSRNGGEGQLMFYSQTLMTDRNGNFINGEYNANIIEGNYSFNEIQDINRETIEIKNVCIDYSDIPDNTTYMFFNCHRNNVCVHDVTLKGFVVINEWSQAVLTFANCCNIEIYNVHGDSPFSVDNSAYIIGLYNVANVYLHDCVMGGTNGSWGCIGSSYVDNFSCERVFTNRIDNHYYFNGCFTVRDSVINNFTMCGGNGTITLENVDIIKPSTEKYALIMRHDLNLLPSGTIYFRNCRFHNFSSSAVFIQQETYTAGVLSDLNYDRTHFIFDNCDISKDNGSFFCSQLGSGWDKVSVEIINSNIYWRPIHNYGDAKLTKGVLRGCIFPKRVNISGVDKLIVTECTGEGVLIANTCNCSHIVNNIFDLTNNVEVHSTYAIIVNNIIRTGKSLVCDSTKSIIKDNLVTTGSNNSAWNVTT